MKPVQPHGHKSFSDGGKLNLTGGGVISAASTTVADLSGAFAPVGADYLVGTASDALSAEIVVGTTPGGELGGTWASPTVAKVNGVAVSGTPAVGYVPTATSSSAATWQAPAGSGGAAGAQPVGQDGEAGEDSWVPGPQGVAGAAGVMGPPGWDGEAGEEGTFIVQRLSTLETVSSVLAADVALTTQNTFYDGPSIVLSPGIWLLVASVNIVVAIATGVNVAVAKLWDGTTVANSAEGSTGIGQTAGVPVNPDGYRRIHLNLSAIVAVPSGSTPTWKVSVTDNTANGGSILAATASNGSGNNASRLDAVKVA